MFARPCMYAALCAVCFAAAPSQAAIIEDVPFDDVAGTEIKDAVNSATGNQFDEDTDTVGVTTNGTGQLNASLKANTGFGSNYIDTAGISSGPLFGVMELSFDFDAGSLDTDENEEIRMSLIQFDPRSTFVTAEFEIQREDDNTTTILGNAVGTGATDIPPQTIGNAESDFVAVIAVHLDSDIMELHYSQDGGASFTSLSGGVLNPDRGVESLRMILNNDLSQDSVLIDRFYLTDMNPFLGLITTAIPEPSAVLLSMIAAAACGFLRRR